jgi:hypothetical protein
MNPRTLSHIGSSLAFGVALIVLLPNSACGGAQGADVTTTGTEAGTSGGSTSDGGSSGTTTTDGGTADGTKFSFFVTSYKAIQEQSGTSKGFGGDLRFGETGAGAGLRGADKICATIAEKSLPGAGSKPWRAFLSATADENGKQVDAIDRIGQGPWYDRLGRVLALAKADLLSDRPTTADAAITNDFPNEDGVPNHRPDPSVAEVDNHDMLTGSSTAGKLYNASSTCLDWTSAKGDLATEGKPRVGHSWPRSGGGGGGGGGPGGGGGSANNWMSALTESGCAPGVNLIETGPPSNSAVTVGSGGGYGGFYCFSLTP